MIQTLAIFRDAYRELNAKKLFWIVMIISALIVGSFACVGINAQGLKFLWWDIPSPLFNTNIFPAKTFYRAMFASLGVKIWLAWIAAILALISTASMIPDFISGGSIELTLSKPIGRFRLFVTKYLAGLLFVTLQVGVFALAAFFVIGFRGGTWSPGLFWAVPFTVAFFSYLFAICVLFGLLTRSTIASLLLTLLIWFGIFAVHTTESSLLMFRTKGEMQVELVQKRIKDLEEQKKTFEQDAAAQEGANADGTKDAGAPASARKEWPKQADLERNQRLLTEREASLKSLTLWHRGFFAAMTALPKTAETVDLLERKLISDADLEELRKRDEETVPMFPGEELPVNQRKLQERLQDKIRSRSMGWVLGTSLAFEALVLGLGALLFCRRDF